MDLFLLSRKFKTKKIIPFKPDFENQSFLGLFYQKLLRSDISFTGLKNKLKIKKIAVNLMSQAIPVKKV